jgi:pyruvate/2-oxoglutarate/acetoin dehydrogenase E1 component
MKPQRILTYSQAIHEAIEQEMARDPSVFVMGQGVDDFKGMYGTTKGLAERFGPDRVFDTPLAEEGMTGVAIGAALAGMRPIHTHIRMDFMLLAMNQIVNIAAKSSYMYGGAVSVPLVIRSVIGRSWGQGAQHSQGLHSLFMHIPGLRVVAPTTPYDAKGCLIASIRDDNPVIFVEHRMVHYQKSYVPEEPYAVPFGKARLLSHGDDVTIVGISYAAVECMRSPAWRR